MEQSALVPALYILIALSTERTSIKTQRGSLFGILELQFGESQIPEEPRIVPQQGKTGRGFYGKKEEVHAGLDKLFTKDLDWRVNTFHIYNWVIKHVSSLTRER